MPLTNITIQWKCIVCITTMFARMLVAPMEFLLTIHLICNVHVFFVMTRMPILMRQSAMVFRLNCISVGSSERNGFSAELPTLMLNQTNSMKHYEVHNVNSAVTLSASQSDRDKVEALVQAIEHIGVDITGDYHQWMRIGFSLASAFGESGRGFYHRVSRFYSGYSNVECNRQYDRCLRARGSGVGLGTFIYLAKAV